MKQRDNQTSPRHVPCTMAEYHSRDEWSNSQISSLVDPEKGPLYFHGAHFCKPALWTQKRKPCFDFGTTVHELLSAPGSINEVAVEIPIDTFRTKSGDIPSSPLATLDYDKWAVDNPHKIHLTPEKMEAARAMVRNAYAHPVASRLLNSALHFEHSLIWQDEETGLPLRSRGDIACGIKDKLFLVDAKSSRMGTLNKFSWSIRDYGYHRQAAFQRLPWRLLGYDVVGFAFFTLHNAPPYSCRVYELDAADIDEGEEELRGALADLAARIAEHGDKPLSDTTAWKTQLDLESVVVSIPKRQDE